MVSHSVVVPGMRVGLSALSDKCLNVAAIAPDHC